MSFHDDPRLDALFQQLEGTKILLQSQAKTQDQMDDIAEKINQTIDHLKTEEKQAIAEKKEAAFYSKVEGLANGFKAMAGTSVALADAIKSGDPFAISASSLDLATSLISTVSLFGGPIGAAAGAVLGAILSIVSTILKAFQKEADSLVVQMEQLIRNIEAEKELATLRTAADDIKDWTQVAMRPRANQAYTYDRILGLLDANTLSDIKKAGGWLETPGNRELSSWCDALALYCQAYCSFKLGIAYWLPIVKPTAVAENATQLLIDWQSKSDDGVLRFLERIKPAARNRGIICCSSGSGPIMARDVVISAKAPWTELSGHAWAIAAAYRHGHEASPRPFLSILHLGGPEPKRKYSVPYFTPTGSTGYIPPIERDVRRWDFGKFLHWDFSRWAYENLEYHRNTWDVQFELEGALRRPFTKKTKVYDMDGQWPLKGKWVSFGDIIEREGAYYIWAIPGDSAGEIDVYTADGDRIRRYIEHKEGSGHLTRDWESERIDGCGVGAVRAVRPKTPPSEDPQVLANVDWAVYGLADWEGQSAEFVILAFYPTGVVRILSPVMFSDRLKAPGVTAASLPDWRNYPVGIAVDSVRLWVFGTSFIACATHTALKRLKEQEPPSFSPSLSAAWMTYTIPSDLLGYDPRERVYMGLRDLSACDDGTLTAVFENKDGVGRIFTATTQFEPGKPIIKPGLALDPTYGDPTPTHGWLEDPAPKNDVHRVHKLPISCWPAIVGLENLLKQKSL